MIDLHRPIEELATAVQSGKLTAVELVQASLARIAATGEYHTVLETAEDAALSRANDIDRRVKGGESIGPLAGIPFIAKDNIMTAATHTTAGSNILAPFKAPYQAVAIERLEAAGAIMVAKANLDAFGHGSSTENSDYGPTKNPVDPARVPGGSSGGPAAAVALGQACFALATDTGGSIRQPASFSGVVGLKPTYGLVPRTGVMAMGSSFDTVGPLANRVAGTALVLDVIAGRHDSDSTTIERDDNSYTKAESKLKGVRIGLIKEYLGEGLEPDVRQVVMTTVRQLEARGAVVEELSLPATELALACYYILIPAEISSNLARYDGVKYGFSAKNATDLEQTYLSSRSQGFGDEAKRRILIGTYVLSSGYYDAYYKRAQKVRTKLIEEFNHAFTRYDFILGPAAPTPAFPLGVNAQDPLAMYLQDVMTVAASLVGIPAICIPAGTAHGLPVGLQLMAPQRAELQLLGTATAIEDVIGDWRQR